VLDSSSPKNREIEIEKASPDVQNEHLPRRIFDVKLKLREDYLALDDALLKPEEVTETNPPDLSPEIKCDNIPSFLRNTKTPSNLNSTAKFQNGENSGKP